MLKGVYILEMCVKVLKETLHIFIYMICSMNLEFLLMTSLIFKYDFS